MRPVISLDSIDIGKVVPICDNIISLKDYPINDLATYYDSNGEYSISGEYVGTGLTTEAMQKTI